MSDTITRSSPGLAAAIQCSDPGPAPHPRCANLGWLVSARDSHGRHQSDTADEGRASITVTERVRQSRHPGSPGCAAPPPAGPRAGRLLPGPADRPAGDHRHLLHRPRPGARRHPLLPVPRRGRGPRRRARTSPAGWPTRTRWPGSTSAAARPSSSATRPRDKSEALLRAYGRFVESLGGRYFTACDVGTYSEDMDIVARECPVRHRPHACRTAARGDSSVLTAFGVFQGMRAAAEHAWGDAEPGRPPGRRRGRRQGRPPPGRAPDRGRRRGRRHRRRARARSSRVAAAHPEVAGRRRRQAELLARELDVYAPCALGGALNDDTVAALRRQDRLRRRQQPARPPGHREAARRPRHPVRARLRGERRRRDPGRRRAARASTSSGPRRGRRRSSTPPGRSSRSPTTEGVPPAVAADRLAERRMAEVGRLRGIWLGG